MENISHHEADIVHQKWKSLFRDVRATSSVFCGSRANAARTDARNGKMFPKTRVFTDAGSPDIARPVLPRRGPHARSRKAASAGQSGSAACRDRGWKQV